MDRETPTNLPVAIVGSGLAGLTLARRLEEAGVPLRLFDKSGDIGGRLATRRRDGGPWNHGAPWVEGQPEDFAAWLEGLGTSRALPGGRFTGEPQMRELLRPLSQDLPLALGRQITRIVGEAGAWFLQDAKGERCGPFAAVLFTLPAPQLQALLERSGLAAFPELDAVAMAPRWSLLLRLREAGSDRALLEGLTESPVDAAGWSLVPAVAVPGLAPAEALKLVAHAPAADSRNCLECPPQQVVDHLRPALERTLRAAGIDPERLLEVTAHRWRHALTERPLAAPCLWSEALALGAAGDWCLGPRAADAWRSANALAEQVFASRGGDGLPWPDFDDLEADAELIGDLRSDHAGETGAVWIYRGLLRFTRDPVLREFAEEHLATERRHLHRFEDWLPPHCRSRLLPLWRLAGFTLGALPLLGGRPWVFATIDAVENFVVDHYDQQIERLRGGTAPRRRLAAALQQFRDDEDHHREDAAARQREAVSPALRLWRRLVDTGSRRAVVAARRF